MGESHAVLVAEIARLRAENEKMRAVLNEHIVHEKFFWWVCECCGAEANYSSEAIDGFDLLCKLPHDPFPHKDGCTYAALEGGT